MMDGLQNILDVINRRFGNVGAIVAVAFWMLVLFFALKSMLFLH